MLIKDITIVPLAIPFDAQGGGSGFKGADWSKLYIVLVRIETDEGIIGWGESFGYACWRPVVYSLQDMFIPLLLNRKLDNISELMRSVQLQMHTFGRYGISMYALSGIDIALWDILAKKEGKPLYKLLNKEKSAQRSIMLSAYASLFKYQDEELVRNNCRLALDLGYTSIKLHEYQTTEIAAARAEVGDDVILTTDVNCCWNEAEAKDAITRLSSYNLGWLEEPIFPPESFAELSRLRASGAIPIAAGENSCTSYEFAKMFAAHAVDYAQPSVTKVGGITEFIKIVGMAKQQGVSIAPHSAYFGPGLLATMQLAASMDEMPMIERFFIKPEVDLFTSSGSLATPINGCYTIDNSPGLGADPDKDILKEYSIKL